MAVGRLARNIVCSMIVFAINQCTYSSDEVTVDPVILSAKKKPCEIDDETLQIGHCERTSGHWYKLPLGMSHCRLMSVFWTALRRQAIATGVRSVGKPSYESFSIPKAAT